MAIQKVEIKSFRSIIKPLTIQLSASLNIFIGQNNSGKTNILDAIEAVCQRQKENAGQISLTFNSGGGQTITAGQALPKGFKMVRLSEIYLLDFEQIDLDYKNLIGNYPKSLATFQSLLSEYFPGLTFPSEALDIDAAAGATFVEHGETITIDRLGSGFQKIFVILLYALHPDYQLLLLDEPENHLHPALIKKLVNVLGSRATNQIIMTTHSPLFITPQNLHQVYRVARTAELGTHYYSMMVSNRQINRQRLVQELNADNLEIFFADRVLIVEGVSDRILMRSLLDRFYHGSLEIKVIFTNGKGNSDVYVEILEAFGIPYVVMLDQDALGWWSTEFLNQRRVYITKNNRQKTIEEMKRFHIYILPNGNIEKNYPRKYQKEKKKPLNALAAAKNLTEADYNSPVMKYLKEIIQAVTHE